jgi:hypothetical protein
MTVHLHMLRPDIDEAEFVAGLQAAMHSCGQVYAR